MSICHFNFALNPVCKTCSWKLFKVIKNNLKKCLFELLLCSEARERWGQPLWDNQLFCGSFVHGLCGTLTHH